MGGAGGGEKDNADKRHRERKQQARSAYARCGRAAHEATVTQTSPLPTVIPAGEWPPSVIVLTTRLLDSGSTRDTVWAPAFATQTALSPTATETGLLSRPSGDLSSSEPLVGSIRMRFSGSCATQSASSRSAR